MAVSYRTIGFIGAGNMGEAMIGALIQSAVFDPGSIYACDVLDQRLDYMRETYKINTVRDNGELFVKSDIVVLAVKPQQMTQTLEELAGTCHSAVFDRKLIISIAAGFPISGIEKILFGSLDEKIPEKSPIVRVMPNTPALVLEGMSGMSPNRYAQPEDIRMTRTILQAFGKVIQFDEKDLNAVTALSGSGPAYVFYLAEAMIEAGIKAGIAPADASVMALKTIRGALKLMEERNEPPESLRKKVTSPGGTTEAALKIFEKNSVKSSIIEGILAAKRRSEELSRL